MKKALISSIIFHPKTYLESHLNDIYCQPIENEKSIELCISWLLTSQQKSGDGGFSRGFYLNRFKGWDRGYIETTGYIVETLLNLPPNIFTDDVKNSVENAIDFLLTVQSSTGYFPCIDNGLPQAFDTGQVLYGLLAYRRYLSSDGDTARKIQIDDAIHLACNWLVHAQDEATGAWIASGYRGIPHTYYSRVASILMACSIQYENSDWETSARKFMKWAMDQKTEEGVIKHLQFDSNEKYSFLHAMAYVIEGFIHFNELTNENRYREFALGYYELILRKTKRLVIPVSKYNDQLDPLDKQYCMTGLAQLAAVGLKLYDRTHENFNKIVAIMYFLKAHQIKQGELKGGMWGSLPLWGSYAAFRVPNWGVKFLLDALLEYNTHNITSTEEQNTWIAQSFSAQKHYIAQKISDTSEMYFAHLKGQILDAKSICDYGAGHGLLVKRLRNLNYQAQGYDPQVSNAFVKQIKTNDFATLGSGYDVILLIETLQHIIDPRHVLEKLTEKMSPNGKIIIYDRLSTNITQFYKLSLQLRDLSMYGPFSPFKENWYNKSSLEKILPRSCYIADFTLLHKKQFKSKIVEPRYEAVIKRRLQN